MTGARIGALGATLAMVTAACIGPGDFRCTAHEQCTAGGFCEADGHCSVAAPDCLPSRRRYVHRAGADSDACVPASCESNMIKLVSAGGGHACLLHEHGSLWCWGRNDRGQLGDGTRTPRALPVRVTGVSDVVAVAAGDAHTCAATAAGTVFCWGADDSGQLGDGGGIDRGLPRVVAGIMTATDLKRGEAFPLASGKDFTCAIDAGGAVRCWGDDSVGQLGDAAAAAGPSLEPRTVAGVADIKAVSAFWQHACALTTGGQVTCWGANDLGQIGDGSRISPRLPTTPAPAYLPTTIPVDKIVTGREHTCALSVAGLTCWGGNGQGQVNPAQPSESVPNPLAITGSGGVDPIDVAVGAQHTCIIREGGDEDPVSCWGANASGQLGAGPPGMSNQPGGGPPISNATHVFAGGAFSCALATDDTLYCWGDNHFGQLAIGGDTVRATPAQVPGVARAGALAAGGAHTCATADDTDGAPALFCWGANDSGQVGNGGLIDAPAPTRVATLAATGIAAGSAHTCAFAADRELRCWGGGAAGQLGREPGFDMVVTVPTVIDLVPPTGNDGVFAVAAGSAHTCVAATISASVLCFGLNTDGQLGNGVPNDPGGPYPVPSLLGRPKALAAGGAHSCAIDVNGAILCWGRGDEGQLGDGTGVEHLSPTAVTLEGDAVAADAITTGAAHTCALAGGRVLCWGRNADGQLGAPLPSPLLLPRPVSGLGQARAVAAGARHTCAIDDKATVSCWGANESGQLGNGSTDSSNVPVPIAGLTNVEAIVAGGAHSCARRDDGTVWCWGANTAGQLGDSVTLSSGRPLLARVACE